MNDIKSRILRDIRALFGSTGEKNMNQDEIYKRLIKHNPVTYGRKNYQKDNVKEVLMEYA